MSNIKSVVSSILWDLFRECVEISTEIHELEAQGRGHGVQYGILCDKYHRYGAAECSCQIFVAGKCSTENLVADMRRLRINFAVLRLEEALNGPYADLTYDEDEVIEGFEGLDLYEPMDIE